MTEPTMAEIRQALIDGNRLMREAAAESNRLQSLVEDLTRERDGLQRLALARETVVSRLTDERRAARDLVLDLELRNHDLILERDAVGCQFLTQEAGMERVFDERHVAQRERGRARAVAWELAMFIQRQLSSQIWSQVSDLVREAVSWEPEG